MNPSTNPDPLRLRASAARPDEREFAQGRLWGAVTECLVAGFTLAEVEDEAARYAYEILFNTVCKGNQCRLAETLGRHRNTVGRRIRNLGLSIAQVRYGRRRQRVLVRQGGVITTR